MNLKKTLTIILSAILIIVSYLVICKCKNTALVSSGDKYLELYQQLISEMIENGTNTISGSEYIAIDTNSFNIASEQDKRLLTYTLQQYHPNIILGSRLLLENEMFMNEDGILKGTYIYAEELEYKANTVNISYTAYRSSLGSFGYKVKATYKNNKWKVKYKAFYIS